MRVYTADHSPGAQMGNGGPGLRGSVGSSPNPWAPKCSWSCTTYTHTHTCKFTLSDAAPHMHSLPLNAMVASVRPSQGLIIHLHTQPQARPCFSTVWPRVPTLHAGSVKSWQMLTVDASGHVALCLGLDCWLQAWVCRPVLSGPASPAEKEGSESR